MLISHKYEVESLLGKGSMGEVYKVRHVTLGVISALKVLPPHLMENPDLVTRFYREARVMAKLLHPNIVRVIDIDHDKELNYHYFVMEYIHGWTLRDFIQERKPTFEEILNITRQVAQALQLAHNNEPPVIHRDIKPANIMLEFATERAVLMDFGIAKELDDAEMTRSEMMLGTVRYSPREQMLYEPLDGRADIYALGMVMYEALTGKHFFSGLNENQVISKVLSDQDNIPEFSEEVPDEFKALITRSIANRRENRYANMGDFLKDLENCRLRYVDAKFSKRLTDQNSSLVSVTDLDAHIQKLELEKKRRLAQLKKTKCQEAKEKAEAGNAAKWVEKLYQGACQQEAEADTCLSLEQFDLAGEGFDKALMLFLDASQKSAVICLQDKVEQLKQNVQAAKAEADHFNAKSKARTLYGRALNLESKAEELLETESLDAACENYSQARKIYEDARELAYFQLQKEATETLRAQTKEAYAKAVDREAEQLTPSVFKVAADEEQKGDAAFLAEDFSQAQKWYRSAMTNYALAEQQALEQRCLQNVLAARKQAETQYARAEDSNAGKYFAVEFSKAVQLNEQARTLEAQQNYQQAEEIYLQAASLFQRQVEQAELLAAREQAEVIRQKLLKEKTKHDKLRKWAMEAWDEVDTLEEEADTVWDQQQYPLALKLYKNALEKHALAERKSIEAKCIEQARLLQNQVCESHQVADQCNIQQFLQDLYQKAVESETEGIAYLAKNQCQEAQKSFYKAKEYFEQALLQRQQSLEQDTVVARKQASEVKARHYARALYDQGEQLTTNAAAFWRQSLYRQAFVHYDDARRVFEEAIRLSVQAFQQEGADAVQAQVREQFIRAESHDLQTILPDSFRQAEQYRKQADKSYGGGDYVEALNFYKSALEELQTAMDRALQIRIDQAAAAQKQAVAAQELAQRAGVSGQNLVFQKGLEACREGEACLSEKSYKKAALSFETAEVQFQQARMEAEQQRKRQAMLEEKKKAEIEFNNAKQAGAKQFFETQLAKASTLHKQAQELENRHDYANAVDYYAQAAREFARLNSETLAQKNLQQLRELKSQLQELQRQVKPVKTYAKKSWEAARTASYKAEKAEKLKDYEQAIPLFDEACRLLRNGKADAELYRARTLKVRESRLSEIKLGLKQGFFRFIESKTVWSLCLLFLMFAGYRILKDKFDLFAPPALSIGDINPKATELTLPDGQKQTFSVQVDHDDREKLDYQWLIDGKPIATSHDLDYEARLDGKTASREIKVVVTDPVGHQVENLWQINITPKVEERIAKVNHSPIIIEASPEAGIIEPIIAGESVDFSVRASDDDSTDALSYSWLLDGKPVADDRTWTLVTPAKEGTYVVTVKISDNHGNVVQRDWRVSTRKRSDNQVPRLVAAEPAQNELALKIGDRIRFSGQAEDSDTDDRLTYVWRLDGRKQSANKNWSYTAKSEGDHSVSLTVADKQNAQVEKNWRLTVEPSARNQPPRIVSAEPSGTNKTLKIGESVRFTVEAEDDDPNDRLSYIWRLNGRKQSTQKTWQFQAKTDGEQDVSLTVSDQGNARVERAWRLQVEPLPENHPPQILSAEPAKEQLALKIGEKISFSAQAVDDDPFDRLTYAWLLNGRKQSSNNFWQYQAKAEGTDTVTLTVLDQASHRADRIWRIAVAPAYVLPPTPKPEVTNPVETVKANIPKNIITEVDVLNWLERVRNTWENKNVSRLVEMGVIDSGNRSQLSQVLSQYEGFRVNFDNVKINLKANNEATVSFNRVDVIDGKVLNHPNRITINLEKQANGRLAVKK